MSVEHDDSAVANHPTGIVLYTDVPTLSGGGGTLAPFVQRSDSIETTSDVTRPPKQTLQVKNRILQQSAESDREMLLLDAEHIRLPVGHSFARPGDAISSVYFPDSGAVSLVSEMTTGHQVAVGVVGAEGVVGLGSLFGIRRYGRRIVVLADSGGSRIAVDRFRGAFEQSEQFRRVALAYIGRLMSELVIAATCNRVHSHRQRLARWLLVTTDKAGQRSLRVTHEMLAQMVGGPRHAVTVALNELRAKGAIAHLRGRIEIVRRSVLVGQACECYALGRLLRR